MSEELFAGMVAPELATMDVSVSPEPQGLNNSREKVKRSLGEIVMKIFVLTLVASALSLPVNAVTITASPNVGSVPLGTPVTVELAINGLGAFLSPSISTYRATLNYNGAVITPLSVLFGSQLDLGSGSVQSSNIDIDSVTLEEFSFASASDLQNLQEGKFVLGTLSFNSIALGGSPLTVVVDNLQDEQGVPLQFNVVSSNVTVVSSAVPEPRFVVPALLCLTVGFFRRTKRRNEK